ncbi:NACHT domain-containing protein [Priestia aryabhattai]|uniref:NACHT domain-containing protein n=1 Tax=Priestia aryabhattai TaxID=412384 RepID=UPI001CFB922E|nr:NACHT domain-containing protein [Priestia aryabhattai]
MSAIASGAFVVSKFLFNKVSDKAFDKAYSKFEEEKLNKKFNSVITIVLDKMEEKYKEISGVNIATLFTEESIFEELVKLLFRNSKINVSVIETKIDITTLPYGFLQEFIANLKEELLKDYEFNQILSDNELYITVMDTKDDINKILETTSLTLTEIQHLKTVIKTKSSNEFSYNEFLESYSYLAVKNLTEVNYFGLGLSPDVRRGKKKLFDIYIQPKFKDYTLYENDKGLNVIGDDNEVKIDMQVEFFKQKRTDTKNMKFLVEELRNKNLVILGKPGSGKSLLGKYIVCSILKRNFSNTFIQNYLPLRIELKEYLPFKKKHDSNFLGYIKYILEKEYYFSNITQDIIIDILNKNKSLIVFDGLDEIFDVNDKLDVKNDIENFLSSYDSCRGIITSRHVGYDEAKFEEEKFSELEILDFNQNQVKQYVKKWYACETDVDEKTEEEINNFLELQREIDGELIKNPLTLSLIVILYRNNGRVPNSKLEIYRSCTRTLVDKWDANKNLEVDIKVKDKKESIFSNLALWQYKMLSKKSRDDISINNKMVHREVVSIIFSKLKLTEDYAEAEKWADEFLEYAKNRSLYFENNFTHKTFLEYFTAFSIYQTSDLKLKPQERNKMITTYVQESFWFIVLELLINLIDENQVDNEIIDDLIEEHIAQNRQSYIFFLQILHTLKNVSEFTVKKIIKNSLITCIVEGEDGNAFTSRLFRSLMSIKKHDKLFNLIQQAYDELFIDFKKDTTMLINYYNFKYESQFSFLYGDTSHNSLEINNLEYIDEVYLNDPVLFQYATQLDYSLDNTLKFIENFGIEKLYETHTLTFAGIKLGSYLNSFISHKTREKNIKPADLILDIKLLIENGVSIDKIKESITNRPILKSEKRDKLAEELNKFLNTINQ